MRLTRYTTNYATNHCRNYYRDRHVVGCWNNCIFRLGTFVLGVALFGVLASPAFAACTQVGSTRVWRCPDTGNAIDNGKALHTLIGYDSAGALQCGDTVVLDAGATYENVVDIGGFDFVRSFRLRAQTGCGQKRTTFVSSRVSELPVGKRVTLADLPKMARVASKGDPTFDVIGYGVNNWAFNGIAFTTAQSLHDNDTPTGYILKMHFDVTDQNRLSDFPISWAFERCIFAPYEEITYGPIEDWYTAGRVDTNTWDTHFRSSGLAVGLEGQGHIFRDNYSGGFTGFDATAESAPEVTFSSCTNASPTICTSTGIATNLSLTNQAASCTTGPTNACLEAGSAGNYGLGGGATLVIVKGATGNWAGSTGINGAVLVMYESADTVSVWEAYRPTVLVDTPVPFDGTGKGALTGTVEAKRAFVLNPQYAILSQFGAVDVKVENNTFYGWGMTAFFGGTTVPTDFRSVVQSGSTGTNLILASTKNLNVGDWITFPAPGVSSACPFGGGTQCGGGGERVGIVTAVTSSTTATITGTNAGFNATDGTTPTTDGVARWNGTPGLFIKFTGNTVYRPKFTWRGKGYIEIKSCKNCLFGGNTLTENPVGNWFVTTHEQGKTPWSTATNFVFADNFMGGQYGSNSGYVLQGADSEGSSIPSDGPRYENNLNPNMATRSGQTLGMMYMFGVVNARMNHNTFLAQDSPDNYTFVSGSDICTYNAGTYGYVATSQIQDNIVGYGVGANGAAATCWTGFPAGITSNVFLNDLAVSTGTINAAFPNNSIAANKAALGMVGTCNGVTWENCALDTGSTYRGTSADGSDPGADIPRLKDRLNRWSEQAGLLVADMNQVVMVNKPGAWQLGSTVAFVRLQLFESTPSSGCTIQIFTTRNRSTAHADTSSATACNRSGATFSAPLVTIPVGTSSALTASTTYFYKIVDGTRVMVGEFTTLPAGSAAAVYSYRYSSARTGNVCTDAAMSTSCSSISSAAEHAVTVPQGAIRYYQAAGGSVQIKVAR